MWAQAQYRSDQLVREILETGDATALEQVARELRLMKIWASGSGWCRR
jgi:hypothetical protein